MKINQRILENGDFIKALKRKRACYSLINEATADQLLILVETCFNILKSRLPLSLKQRRTLAEYAHVIRKLSRARTPETARKTLLQQQQYSQNGKGFIAAAAAAAIPLATILSSILLPLLGVKNYKDNNND